MILSVGSLYSGAIDAFGYAVNILGGGKYVLKWQIEKERAAHKYLKKNHPNAKRYYFDEWFRQYELDDVNLICGGDPCQPNSNAGLMLGENDDRFRWNVMFDIIQYKRPTWVVNENVIGSISNMVFDKKKSDLEKIGYSTQGYVIPAVACGAEHTRNRVFLIANSNVQRRGELLCTNYGAIFETCKPPVSLGTQGNAFLQFQERFSEPAVFPLDDGIPDHVFRLGAAGNSIYAAIPIVLLTAIYEVEKHVRQ